MMDEANMTGAEIVRTTKWGEMARATSRQGDGSRECINHNGRGTH